LRYPGGKQRLGPFFAALLDRNEAVGGQYVEAFAGGAGVGLYLLRNGLVESIRINDLDRSIYAFWYAVTRRNSALQALIRTTPVSVAEWDRQRQVQREKSSAPLLELGFSTLFLNRTNRSGILRAGMIGGRRQDGPWRLDARFDREALASRIGALRTFSSQISPSCSDAIDFLGDVSGAAKRRTTVYLDPPYFVKGRDLYLHRYTMAEHEALAAFVKNRLRCRWVLTYDDVADVRRLYAGYRLRSYALSYTADARSVGREVMVTPDSVAIPRFQLTV